MMIYPWQHEDWGRLHRLRAQWPHALLFFGQAGIGKLAFAQHLAHSFLCEAPQANGEPCGACDACHWFIQHNHPDYRAVLPEALAGDIAVSEASSSATAPLADEKADTDGTKKARAPSKEIKIEQIRALVDFCAIGSHRGGARVVLLYPAEALNIAASNALLKTLEEPPAGVFFLLVSARVDQLLPTIVSRCRQWPLSAPPAALATTWLAEQGVTPTEANALLAEAGGAPLMALRIASDEHRLLRELTLAQLAAGAACDAFACSEALQKTPVPVVLGWLQRWLYDLLAQRIAHRPRYFPHASRELAHWAARIDMDAFMRYMRMVLRQRTLENHPLNPRLVFEALFIGYRDLFVL